MRLAGAMCMTRSLTVLGLESSCDETAAAVVRLGADGGAEVVSSVVASQIAAHAPYGGVVPEVAARAHVELIEPVARQALAEAGVDVGDLAGIAATAGPGLVGAVMVGLSFGKGLALAAGKPLIAVNHLEGHALSARLEADLPYPFLLLLVSGGHCQLLDVAGIGACKRLGLPAYSQRAFRRMFITRAIQRGIDVKVIAEWQGHKDGGKLILGTYSHVMDSHSSRMAQLMTDGEPEMR